MKVRALLGCVVALALAVQPAWAAPLVAGSTQAPPTAASIGAVAVGGDISSNKTSAIGGSIASNNAARWGNHLDAKLDFGAGSGTGDDGALINSGTAALAAAGGGTITIPYGTYNIQSTLLMRTNVRIQGLGSSASKLKCAVSPCISKSSGAQLYGAALTDVGIQNSTTSDVSDVVLSFDTVSLSEIGRVLIEGFTSSPAILLTGGALAGTLYDTNLGSNVIWNNFHDITVYGCSICVVLQGHFPSVGAAPDQVNTQNIYSNINLYYVTTKGWDFINAADTNVVVGGLINISGVGAVGVVQGDDPNYSSTANTYVNSNKFFGLAFSHQSSATSLTMFGGNYSFATEGAGIETDIDTTNPSFIGVNLPNAASYRICGKRLDSNTNLYLGCQEKGIAWKQLQTYAPSTGFVIAWPSGFNQVTLTTNGTLATGQIQMPCSPPENTDFSLTTTGTTVTTLTIASCSGAGQSVYGSPGTISPTTPVRFKYIVASKSWVRS